MESSPNCAKTLERRQRILQLQCGRRAKKRRIDYYAAPDVVAIIKSMGSKYAGGDYSSILNRIVAEWAAARAKAGGGSRA